MRYVAGILFALIAALPYGAMLLTGREASLVAESAEILTLISPHRREVKQEYTRAFGEWLRQTHGREADLRWLDVGGTSKAMKDLESRFEANPDAPGVDILFGGGVEPYLRARREGWLLQVKVPAAVLEGIPERCAGFPVYDPQGYWYGVAMSGFGIVYNRPLLDQVGIAPPRTWEDLGKPEYFTWIGSGDPRSSGSVHVCYEIILQALGFESGWSSITRLCANVRRFGEGGGAAPREVASAEVAAGMVIDQYARTVVSAVGGDLLEFVLPQGLTMINPDAIGVLHGAPNPELAKLFVEFVLREEGQRLLFQPEGRNGQRHALHRLTVRADLYDDPDAPRNNPYRYTGGFRYDTNVGSRRWRLVNDMIGVCLIDQHRELTRTWRAVIGAGCPEQLVREMCRPPVAENELPALATQWKDSRARLEITSAWAAEATQRYRRIRREAEKMKALGTE